MNKKSILPICIYTIVHTDRLDDLYQKGGKGEISENKNWATAKKLLKGAQGDDVRMLVIFASAEHTNELIYYADLEDVAIEKKDSNRAVTTFQISKLVPFEDPKPHKTSLTVKSTGRDIPENHIRPYVICHTPESLMGL